MGWELLPDQLSGQPVRLGAWCHRYKPEAAFGTLPAEVGAVTMERNSAPGDYLSKPDVRLSKAVQAGGDVRLTGFP